MEKYKWLRRESRLELQNQNDPKSKPIYVDFLEGSTTYRRTVSGKQLLLKAIKIKGNPRPFVLDVTAGLGRDAFVLAHFGCRVVMCERSEPVAALLEDGLTRLKQVLPAVSLELVKEDARHYLASLRETQRPEVIYLDPMFPERTKSAAVKKECRVLRDLVGDDNDAVALLELALTKALYKVVVKRSLRAPPLGGLKPSGQIVGKAFRFDIYPGV